ncbi:Target SNARE coiled-coil domain-containing protein [Penicillium ucsense]|uniref:Protein transport protein SEC9 n=1 Tax=Penicillium ucsense TaxID=2839758 RepID=A0A8J8VXL1_9EURO|nr:Target SNARE coiled-coil domain-containing protein [Penicillium ucsense]KAF7728719.1 Target SNARE coiled-coil domain-containing protein [Penicillium ucsense]
MGLFKKHSEDGEESSRRALFGSRSKNKSPAAASNPYAQPAHVDPYTKAKIQAGVTPPPAGYQGGTQSPAPAQGPHAIPSDNKYSANAYGNQGGYGGDRYGNGGNGNGAGASRYGTGGYGGLGNADPNDPGKTDAARNELFGGARDRTQSGPNGAPPPYSPGQGGEAGGQGGNYGGGSNEYSMATYQDRQLTAEEEEEEHIQATKQEMKFVKQGDVASTRNALRAAAMAEETGRSTLARLGAQGEMVHDAEKNLDMATVEGRLAQEKARELKTLNKSMFAVHVSNPFTSASRRRERDERILNTHREERDQREGTRSEAYQTNARMDKVFRDIDREANKQQKGKKANVTERAKYQFEADSEDEAMEDEIEQNLDLLSGAAGRLNGLAKATGQELDQQNRHLERITGKSDYVDDQIAMNRAKLDRIR